MTQRDESVPLIPEQIVLCARCGYSAWRENYPCNRCGGIEPIVYVPAVHVGDLPGITDAIVGDRP